jgi:proline iminopeptidase
MRVKVLIICFFIFFIHCRINLLAQDTMDIKDGLAIYRIGKGQPVLLMPYPHASAYQSMSKSSLVSILNNFGFSVITFDPPGIYHSTREADVTLDEMLQCTNELLDYFGIKDSIMIIGHSQSGFCSIAYSIEFPEKVKSLILIGSVSGWPMVKKSSIHKQFSWFSCERWKMMYWGTRKMINMSNMLIHKKLDQLVENYSYYDKTLVYEIQFDKSDRKISEPIRAKWMVNLRKYNYDYSNRLREIDIPVLICVGKHDPQTPVEANMELKNKISTSIIEVFDYSGHLPFVEEKDKFIKLLDEWIKNPAHNML